MQTEALALGCGEGAGVGQVRLRSDSLNGAAPPGLGVTPKGVDFSQKIGGSHPVRGGGALSRCRKAGSGVSS